MERSAGRPRRNRLEARTTLGLAGVYNPPMCPQRPNQDSPNERTAAHVDRDSPAAHPTGRVWILATGTELTLGQSLDTNSAWLARELAGVGLRCERFVTVADDEAALVETLRAAAAQADVVVITGGLGPTADDLTRAALARAANSPLVSDPQSLEQIRAFFERRRRVMPEANAVQALRPACGQAITNPTGTAPGLRVPIGRCMVFSLPGVPSEMKAMFAADVLPQLRGRGQGVIRSRILHCVGRGESEIGSRIAEFMVRGRNPEVGTTAAGGIVGVRINATAATPAEADARLDEAERELRERLGSAVFGRDGQTLARAVGDALIERGRTLALAESCTGGLISEMLTAEPGISRCFLGGVVVYANEAKSALLGVDAGQIRAHGAVSAAVAEAMADGARRRFGATFALSVTGIAGPDGGSAEKPVGLVWVGFARELGVESFELRLGEDSTRAMIRQRAALAALNHLRLALLEESSPRSNS